MKHPVNMTDEEWRRFYPIKHVAKDCPECNSDQAYVGASRNHKIYHHCPDCGYHDSEQMQSSENTAEVKVKK